jgi:CIC family chloride channel protein
MSEEDRPGQADEPAPPEEKAPSPSELVASASQTSQAFGRRGRPTLSGTGYYKPLPASGRLQRALSALGLMLGRRLAVVVHDDHIYLILMAAIVGVTSGAAAALLLLWIEGAYAMFPTPEEGMALRWSIVIGVPVLGGLLVGLLRYYGDRLLPEKIAEGVPAVIEAVDRRGGNMSGGAGVALGLGTGLTIASGGSVGHEGSTVAIGATAGSVVARFFGFRLRRQVAMVGAGTAAGLAAAFNAPLAGVIFTVELVFGRGAGGTVGTMSVFIPLIVAAVAGTFTSHAIFGPRLEFVLPTHGGVLLSELFFFVLLALIAGGAGTVMSRAITWTTARFEKLPIRPWLKPALGGLGVGLLAALVSNELLGSGRSTVAAAVQGNLLWQTALILVGLKIVATSFTFGSGGLGGVFMPSLYVGSCLGTLVGTLAHLVLGDGAGPIGAYALVGMGAMLSSMMHAPLFPIVMIFELTHDYAIILPLMLACILSAVLARRLHPENVYKQLLGLRGFVPKHEAEGEVMRRGNVRTLMVAAERVLTEGATLEEIRGCCLDAGEDSTFVVDDTGGVIGYVDGADLARKLLGGSIAPDATARDLMGKAKLALLYPDDTLAGAMLAFARANREVLPVVDRDRHLLGIIRRGDLIAHYSENVLGRQGEVIQVSAGEGTPDHEVGLSDGVILERVVVRRGWAGSSLAELDLQGQAGVMVLEWRRGERVLPIDPDEPLREADEIALVGTRDEILRARNIY